MIGEQGTLFPLSQFEPVETILKDLVAYADEQEKLTANFVEHGRKRRSGPAASCWRVTMTAVPGTGRLTGTHGIMVIEIA